MVQPHTKGNHMSKTTAANKVTITENLIQVDGETVGTFALGRGTKIIKLAVEKALAKGKTVNEAVASVNGATVING